MLMWLVEHVPVWFVYLLLATGTLGIIASYVLRAIPLFGTYATEIRLGAVACLIAGVWAAGAVFVSDEWKDRLATANVKAAEAATAMQAVNTELVTRVKDYELKLKEKQHVRTQYITKYITQYDNRCDLPNATIGVLSAAAENTVPPSPSSTDGDSSNVTISEVVQNTSDNYTTYYKVRNQLMEWQKWYTEQKAIFDKATK